MAEGYKKMFWGAILISFTVAGGLMTLLIALTGWIIIVYGLDDNDKKSLFGDFTKLRLLTIRLAAVSVLGGALYLLDDRQIISFAQLCYYPLCHIVIELIIFDKVLDETVLNFDWMDRMDSARKYSLMKRRFVCLMGITIAVLSLYYIFNLTLLSYLALASSAASKLYLLWIIYSLSHEDHEEMLNDGEYSYTIK